MTVAREQQICLEETPYYHVISRCVRRAFLCGEDTLTGESFEHRRQWLIGRIKKVASVSVIFKIVVAYLVKFKPPVIVKLGQRLSQFFD